MTGLCIVGTDTGVGKTVIAGAIARLLVMRGVDVAVMKPVETGCRMQRGKIFPADGAYLKAAARCEDALDHITPYRYPSALSPYAAGCIEKRRISARMLIRRMVARQRSCAFLLVEGIGGLLVPLSARTDWLDVVKGLDLPVLLVARSGLGTLNHTQLTWREGLRNGLKFAGIILNQSTPRKTLADHTNPKFLSARCKVPIVSFPYDRYLAAPMRSLRIQEQRIARSVAILKRHAAFISALKLPTGPP